MSYSWGIRISSAKKKEFIGIGLLTWTWVSTTDKSD